MTPAEALARDVADAPLRRIPLPTVRSEALPRLQGRADAIVGVRRAGKTWFAFQELGRLRAAGVSPSRSLYLNFEDERFVGLQGTELGVIPDTLDRLYPNEVGAERWLFLDEIHLVPEWERFVRRMLDGGQARIVVTGSSAKMLSQEIATSLRGRSLATELLPFSFRESLTHLGFEVPDTWPAPSPVRARLRHHLDVYLEAGGFPEVQGLDAELRTRLLSDMLDVVVLRDIIERHGVSQPVAMRWLVRRTIGAPCGKQSANKIFNDLKSQGYHIAKDTVHAYLAHLEDALLVYGVPIHTASERARMVNPRKFYVVDTGLARRLMPRMEVGHLLENAVYLELRRRRREVAYVVTEQGLEVDFLSRDFAGDSELIQVTATLSDPETRKRELRALEAAMVELGIQKATIVTLDTDDIVTLAGSPVAVIPAWRWLLGL